MPTRNDVSHASTGTAVADRSALSEDLQRCSQCILPETYPGLRLDEDEVCNFCRDHKAELEVRGREALEGVLNSQKSVGQYDCLVPLSGGKDSTYVLYYAVKELGLRAMAMEYDGGFQHPIAKQNIANACDKLGVPLVTVESPAKLRARAVRKSLRLSEVFGSFVTICGNCEPVLRISAIRLAKQHQIPFVLWGAGRIESSNYGEYLAGRTLRQFLARKVAQFRKAALTPVRTLRLLPRLAGWWWLSSMERLSAGISLRYAFRPFSDVPFTRKNPTFLQFFEYIRWDSMRDIPMLQRELGWSHPEGNDSRFDCLLGCFKNRASLYTRDITANGTKFCRFIRDGKMTRDEALARELYIASTADEGCYKILKRLGLDGLDLPSAWL